MKNLLIILAFVSIGASAQSSDLSNDYSTAFPNEAKDTLFVSPSMYGIFCEVWDKEENSDVIRPVIVRVINMQQYAIRRGMYEN